MNGSPKIRAETPPAWATSVDVWVMLQPTVAYQWLGDRCLTKLPETSGKWTAVRRPLCIALLLGCMVSLVASQRLTLRHVMGGAFSGSFLLFVQVAAFGIVYGRKRAIPLSSAMDLFFAGYGPWILWALAFSYLWAFLPEELALRFFWSGSVAVAGGIVTLWSLYLDYRFFRVVLKREQLGAIWDVARFWSLSWCVCIVIFGWSAVPSEVSRVFSR